MSFTPLKITGPKVPLMGQTVTIKVVMDFDYNPNIMEIKWFRKRTGESEWKWMPQYPEAGEIQTEFVLYNAEAPANGEYKAVAVFDDDPTEHHSNMVIVRMAPVPPASCPEIPVNDLNALPDMKGGRDSCYMWAGWWIIDEIKRAKAEGIDWKNPFNNNLKYPCQISKISELLNGYDNVDIQESRNGYILHKEDFI